MHQLGNWIFTTMGVGLQLTALVAVAEAQQTRRIEERAANAAFGLADSDVQWIELSRDTHQSAGPVVVKLTVKGREDLLILHPVDVRSADFQILVQREDGSFAIRRGAAPTTYRGELTGQPNSRVAASVLEDGIHARILLDDGEELWLEPLANRFASAAQQEHVLYYSSDVIATNGICGTEVMEEVSAFTAVGAVQGADPDAISAALEVELACDADYEYFSRYGSASAVSSRIQAIVNAVNLQYETTSGLTHRITSVVVRTSASQPYTGTHANSLLIQMKDDWNANRGGVKRDVAQLFTGKALTNGVVGAAYVGSICSLAQAYGVVQSDFDSNFACVTDLTAHELGHGYGAGHCSCPAYTMNAVTTCANVFSPTTVALLNNARQALISFGCIGGGGGGPTLARSFATSDLQTVPGTISGGSYSTTKKQDNVYEVITEEVSGGNPSNRTSRLSHVWTIDVASVGSHTFFLDAYHSYNQEGDDFLFSYSRNGSTYRPMLTVSNSSGSNFLQSYAFPEDVAGTLYVKVEDVDSSPGNSAGDSVYIDFMFVETDPNGTPNAIAAKVVTRNAGTNPGSYVAQPPVLGTIWTATVDLTTTGHGVAMIRGFTAAASITTSHGVVLIDLSTPEIFRSGLQSGPIAQFSVPVPNDPDLAGVTIYTQAGHLTGQPAWRVSNAQDLTFGY